MRAGSVGPFLVLIFLISIASVKAGQEQEIAVDKVPAKVKAAAIKAVKGLTITEAEVEAVLIYEVEGTADGEKYEILITAEGKVIGKNIEKAKDDEKDDDKDDDDEDDEDDEDEAEHELEIPLKSLPAKVKAAAMKAVKGIKLTEAEVGAVLIYELEGKVGKKEVEIEVTATGKVLEIENEDDDDD